MGQGIVLLAAPILSRLYTPADFGLLAVFFAVLAIVSAFATLRFEMAIPLPKSTRRAHTLALLAGGFTLVTAAVAAIGLPLAPQISHILREPRLASVLWLVPIGVVGAGLFAIMTNWAIRVEAFRAVGRGRVVQPLATTLVQLAGGLVGAGGPALAVGQAIGRLTAGVGMVLQLRPSIWRRVSRRELVRTARRYRAFPLLNTPSVLVNTASLQLPVIVLASAFGPVVTGQFALTVRVIQLPMATISQSVAPVFLGAISRDRSGMASATLSVLELLLAVAAGPFLVAAIVAPVAFADIFGAPWSEAGTYAAALTPWVLAAFVGQPLASIAYVTERQSSELTFQVVLLLTRLGSVWAGAAAGDALLAMQLLGLSGGVLWAVLTGYLIRGTGASLRVAGWLGVREALVAVLMAAPVLTALAVGLPRPALYAIAALVVTIGTYRAWKKYQGSRLPERA